MVCWAPVSMITKKKRRVLLRFRRNGTAHFDELVSHWHRHWWYWLPDYTYHITPRSNTPRWGPVRGHTLHKQGHALFCLL